MAVHTAAPLVFDSGNGALLAPIDRSRDIVANSTIEKNFSRGLPGHGGDSGSEAEAGCPELGAREIGKLIEAEGVG